MKFYDLMTRTMPVADVAVDNGILEALFVPWDVPTTIYGEEPEPYQEGFRRTAFDDQLHKFPESVRSVSLMPRHQSTETFGNTREIRATDAGLWGAIRLLPSRVADVRAMVADGIDRVSIEFHPLQSGARPAADGVRWRDRAYLTGIVLTSIPAYADAGVLAMRERQQAEQAEAERVARLAALDAELASLRSAGEKWHTGR